MTKSLLRASACFDRNDRFVRGVQEIVDMPASTLDLLHRFLHQNGGLLSKRARAKEFQKLRDQEIERI